MRIITAVIMISGSFLCGAQEEIHLIGTHFFCNDFGQYKVDKWHNYIYNKSNYSKIYYQESPQPVTINIALEYLGVGTSKIKMEKRIAGFDVCRFETNGLSSVMCIKNIDGKGIIIYGLAEGIFNDISELYKILDSIKYKKDINIFLNGNDLPFNTALLDKLIPTAFNFPYYIYSPDGKLLDRSPYNIYISYIRAYQCKDYLTKKEVVLGIIKEQDMLISNIAKGLEIKHQTQEMPDRYIDIFEQLPDQKYKQCVYAFVIFKDRLKLPLIIVGISNDKNTSLFDEIEAIATSIIHLE